MIQIDALAYLTRDWAVRDIQHNKDFGPYVPTLPVIANRIASYYYGALWRQVYLSLGFHDAWMEEASYRKGRTYDIGFRDNRDPATYNARCGALAERLSADGWKVTIQKGNRHGAGRCDALYVTLPGEIETQAAEIYPAYLAKIGA